MRWISFCIHLHISSELRLLICKWETGCGWGVYCNSCRLFHLDSFLGGGEGGGGRTWGGLETFKKPLGLWSFRLVPAKIRGRGLPSCPRRLANQNRLGLRWREEDPPSAPKAPGSQQVPGLRLETSARFRHPRCPLRMGRWHSGGLHSLLSAPSSSACVFSFPLFSPWLCFKTYWVFYPLFLPLCFSLTHLLLCFLPSRMDRHPFLLSFFSPLLLACFVLFPTLTYWFLSSP